MAAQGLLQGMAHRELDELIAEIRRDYHPGALDALAGVDPEWRRDLERAEREVGGLYEALGEADTTVVRWYRALGELRGLWRRVGDPTAAPGQAGRLHEVA